MFFAKLRLCGYCWSLTALNKSLSSESSWMCKRCDVLASPLVVAPNCLVSLVLLPLLLVVALRITFADQPCAR